MVIDGRLRYALLQSVERKWGTSRYSGTIKWRYRPRDRSRHALDACRDMASKVATNEREYPYIVEFVVAGDKLDPNAVIMRR